MRMMNSRSVCRRIGADDRRRLGQPRPVVPRNVPVCPMCNNKEYLVKKFLLVILGLLVVVVVVSAASGSSSTSNNNANEAVTVEDASSVTKPNPNLDGAAQNIKITSCGVEDLGDTKFADIAYTVNNPTGKSSDYVFQVALIDSTGASVSQAYGFESNVLPGRPSQGKASGNVSDSATGPYTCEISDVTRTAAN